MSKDVTITDGANLITFAVDQWTYDLQRAPKEFTLKFLSALGTTKSVSTDFGSFTEFYSLRGTMTSRADVNTLLSYANTDWFTNRPITVAMAALSSDDDAIDFTTVSGTEAVITGVRIRSDLDADGASLFRYEVTFAICKRL